MSGWTIGWLCWLGWFLLEEGFAVGKGGRSATLSGHVWKWFAVKTGPAPSTVTRLRRVALLGFLTWLVVHFLGGGAFV
jgi:hypothetical protein